MEYISAEEFLKQPEDIQKVFIDWWKLNVNDYDLCQTETHFTGLPKTTIDIYKNNISLGLIYPLLTEGQLRKFIEDITGNIFDTKYGLGSKDCKYEFEFQFYRYIDFDSYFFVEEIKVKANRYIEAMWKLACKLAEEVSNE